MTRRLGSLVLLPLCSWPACDGDGGGNPDADVVAEDRGGDGETTPEGDASEDGDAADDAPPVCHPGSAWAPGTPAFRDVTAEWGLDGVQAVVLAVGDIDGDGWADVFARQSGEADDFTPGGIRHRWVLRNTGAGSFEDATEASGLLHGRADPDPGLGRPGAVFSTGDVDNDGDLDVFIGNGRLTTDPAVETSELMLNDGDGTFSLGPEASEARFPRLASAPLGNTFVDVDRDGNLDLWVVMHQNSSGQPLQDRLLLGDGTGGFTDVTYDRGLFTQAWTLGATEALNEARGHSWGWAAAACDLNDDGIPELLASSYGRAPNHLWRGTLADGLVEYVNASVSSGYAYDHRQDWRTNLNAQCYCRDNPTEAECDTVTEDPGAAMCSALFAGFGGMYRWDHASDREPWRMGGNSGTTVCADIDNDGDLDLLTHEIVHFDVGSSSDPAELMVNTGDPDVVFERPGNDVTGLLRVHADENWNDGDMTGAVFDFDNDGKLDVYIGASDYPDNYALLFHQEAPLEFLRVETDDYFRHYRAQGNAVADFDRDGDLDILVGHSRMRCDIAPEECQEDSQVHLFENLLGEGSNWLQLRLEGGPGTNRAAIGARVEVAAGGETQRQDVDGGHGQGGLQRDLALHFGLGAACEAEVTIRWPDAALTTQTFTVPANARYRVVQDNDPTRE
ncbi:MAG: CRTAC1 family protein [Deltaproteobacteria bacterium]|nr:CRTAC1 family protein [Deltaproteobacteria bacterium]